MPDVLLTDILAGLAKEQTSTEIKDTLEAVRVLLADTGITVNLPSGLATEAKQDTVNGLLTDLYAVVTGELSVADGVTQSTLADIRTRLAQIWNIMDDGVQTVNVSGLVGVQADALPLPAGAATEESLEQAVAKLTSINTALAQRADIATSVYTDDSGAYYVRRDVVNADGSFTVTWTDSSGAPATPGTGLRPLGSTNKITTSVMYDATSGGTGYSTGDVLSRVLILDVSASPPTAVAVWQNMTTGLTMSMPPTAGTYVAVAKDIAVTSSVLPSGASTAAKQDTGNTSLASIDAGIGGASAAAAGDTGASTVNGFLRWVRDKLKAWTGQQTSANSLSVVQSSDSRFLSVGLLVDSTGVYWFNRDSCSEVNTYNADDTIATTTLTDPLTANVYRKTFTWTSGRLTSVTGWVKQ